MDLEKKKNFGSCEYHILPNMVQTVPDPVQTELHLTQNELDPIQTELNSIQTALVPIQQVCGAVTFWRLGLRLQDPKNQWLRLRLLRLHGSGSGSTILKNTGYNFSVQFSN